MKRLARWTLWLAISGFIALNLLAYHHARAFFFYSGGEERTPSPENLSWQQKTSILFSGINVPKPKAHSNPSQFGMPYEVITLPGADDVKLAGWLIRQSNAPSVMLVFHGYSSEKSGMLPEATQFYAMGFEVVMVDFAGHGDSPGQQTTLGIREAEDVASVLNWARSAWPERKIFVYGHSMGGAAVMRAMAELDVRPDAAIVESVFDTLLEAIRFRFDLLSVPSFPAAEILLFWGSQQLGVDGFEHDIVKYAGAVDVPVMMIHGGRDRRASAERSRRVFDALRAERKEFLLIEKAGHVNPCVTDPELWASRVRNFLN